MQAWTPFGRQQSSRTAQRPNHRKELGAARKRERRGGQGDPAREQDRLDPLAAQ